MTMQSAKKKDGELKYIRATVGLEVPTSVLKRKAFSAPGLSMD